MASGSTYYRDRAICRKIVREGTGLVPSRMSQRELEQALQRDLTMLIAHVADNDLANVALVRSIVRITELHTELIERVNYNQLRLAI